MNRHVNAIAGRLSLRAPQRRSLEILDRITEIIPPNKGAEVAAVLEIIRSEFPSVTDFERDFPSLCFALATGVGKTRLMGAFISYLHLAHGINNFFVLAPNLTIYNKLITDFSDRTHSKYVFKGISEFAIDAPFIITGDNYDQHDPASGTLFGGVRINIFNISKINSEVRGGKAPRIKRLSEYIGESYFDYLAGLLVVPKGDVKAGFKPFTLKLEALKYPAISEELWIQHLRTSQLEVVTLGNGGMEEKNMEDYVVSGLVDFDDVSYDDQADLLYELAAQTIKHFCSYLSEDDTRKVLRCYQRPIAQFIHAQMQEHSREVSVDYEVVVSKGFTEFKSSAYTYAVNEPSADYRVSPVDKSNMSKYVFGGFRHCLYPVQKFDSEAERVLAVILDRDADKWFKPAKGQFQLFYKLGANHLEYQPDFVAETKNAIYMLEPKASNQMENATVLAKKEAAIKWCKNASDYAAANGGKPWRYVLIPHTAIAVNMMLDGLAGQFG